MSKSKKSGKVSPRKEAKAHVIALPKAPIIPTPVKPPPSLDQPETPLPEERNVAEATLPDLLPELPTTSPVAEAGGPQLPAFAAEVPAMLPREGPRGCP